MKDDIARNVVSAWSHGSDEPFAPIAEHALVRTLEAVSEGNLSVPAGSTGTVVFIHNKGEAFEVELDPPFVAVVSLRRRQVEAV